MSQLGDAIQRLGQSSHNLGSTMIQVRDNTFNKIDSELQNYINAQLAGINPNATPEEYEAEFNKIFSGIDANFIRNNIATSKLNSWSAEEYMSSSNRQDLIDAYKHHPSLYKAGYAQKEHDRVQSELGSLILSMINQEEGVAQKAINSEIYGSKLDSIRSTFSSAEEIHKLLPDYSMEAIEEFLSKHKDKMFGDYEHKKKMFGDNRIEENERKKHEREKDVAKEIINIQIQDELQKASETANTPEEYESLANEAIQRVLGSSSEFAEENNLSEQAVLEAFGEYEEGNRQILEATIKITKNNMTVGIERNITSSKLKKDVEDIGKDFGDVIDEHLKTVHGEDGDENYIDSAFSYMIQPNEAGEDVFESRLKQEMRKFYEDNPNCTFTEFLEKYKSKYDELLGIIEEKFKGNDKLDVYAEGKRANKSNYAESNARSLFKDQQDLRIEENKNIQNAVEEKFLENLDYAPTDEELREMIHPELDEDRKKIYDYFKVMAGERALSEDMHELEKIDITKSLTELFDEFKYGTEDYEATEGVFESDEKTLYEERAEMGEKGKVSKGDKFTEANAKSINYAIGSEGNTVVSLEGATVYTRHTAVVEAFFDTHPTIEPTYYNIQYIASMANQLTSVDGALAKKQADDIVISGGSIQDKLADLDKIKGHLSLQTYQETKNKIEKYDGQSQTWKDHNSRLDKYYDSTLASYGIKAPTSSGESSQDYALYWMFKTPEVSSMFEEMATEYENTPEEEKVNKRTEQEKRITDYIESTFGTNMSNDIASSTSWAILTGNSSGLGFTNGIAKEQGGNSWARYCSGDLTYLNDNPVILDSISTFIDQNKDDKDVTLDDLKNQTYHMLNPHAPVDEDYKDIVKASKKKKNPVVSPWIGVVEESVEVATQGKRFEQVVRDFLFDDDDYIGINVAGQGIMYYSPSKHIVVGQNPNDSGTGIVQIYKPKAGVENEIIERSRHGKTTEDGNKMFMPSFSMPLDKFELASDDTDLSILVMPEETTAELDRYRRIAYHSPETARRTAIQDYKKDSSLPKPLASGDYEKAYDKTKQNEEWKSIIWSNPVFLNIVN